MPSSSEEKSQSLLLTDDDDRTKEEILRNIVSKHPISLEPEINTLSDPLMIECACPGWQPREWPPLDAYDSRPSEYEEDGIRFGAVPCSLEEQALDIAEAVREGCALAHVHPRDPETCLGTDNIDLLIEVYDRVYDETDVVPSQHAWQRSGKGKIDYVTKAEEHLDAAGGDNRYIQAALVLWPGGGTTPGDSYPSNFSEAMRAGVEFYLENDIKPIHKVRGSFDARRLAREVVEPGLYEDPLVVVHDMGHPFGWPMDLDTWMPIELISSIEQTKLRVPDNAIIGVYSGRRNWMPVTMMAILAGVDLIRIGIEDMYWMYPHRDEIIQQNIDCVRKITEFSRNIGRDLATPEMARDILGMSA